MIARLRDEVRSSLFTKSDPSTPETRFRIGFLRIITYGILPLGVVSAMVLPFVTYLDLSTTTRFAITFIGLLSAAFVYGAYRIAQAGYDLLASYLVILVALVAVSTIPFMGVTNFYLSEIDIMRLLLPIILASLLLPFWSVIIVATIALTSHMVGALILFTADPPETYKEVILFAVLYLAILLIGSRLRDRLEDDRATDIRLSRERFRSVVEDQFDFICRLTADTRKITFTNVAFEGYFGCVLPEGEVLETRTILAPDRFEEIYQGLATLTLEKPTATIVTHDERRVSWHVRALYNRARLVEYQLVGRDITQEIELQDNIHKLVLQKEKMNLLARFLRDAAHDIKTPLTTISLSTQMLGRQLDPTHATRVSRLQESVDSLQQVLDSMFTMVELDSLERIERVVADLRQVITHAMSGYSDKASQSGIELAINMPDDQVLWPVNSELMVRAITNVVTNAFQHTEQGDRIAANLIRELDQVVIEVEDSGQGIEEDRLPYIFDRFYRVNEARSEQGRTGLGLAIAKRIVELHDGTIAVSSQPEQGTTFKIQLPLNSR